ncbi:MAG TPA: FAD-binding and (Fe-S)-binding domain-containing protein [Xanthobacteraceae bacterium]|nr:FAD-binding and (Fe-S)-binding domain-containing protein [Xanthobacteraceae bacterium]
MSHVVEIRHGSNGQPPRHVDRTPDGRISSDYELAGDQDFRELARMLERAVDGEVRFDDGSRALYATDASNYRQVPIGVIVPRSVEDVVATVSICCRHGVPIVNRGGGTALAGQGCNVAVLIDFSKYLHNVLDIDPERRLARVQPGCVLDELRNAAEKHHLTFGPDPATHDHNTLGGMLGNNSCGVHSVMAGRTSDNVRALDVLTYDGLHMEVGPTSEDQLRALISQPGRRGEIYRSLDDFRRRYGDMIRARFPKIPRRVSGYENLDELLPEKGFNVARALVGTESTCVTILGATLELVESPPERVLAILGFDDVFMAADAVPDVLTYGPIGLEGIDDELVQLIKEKHFHTDELNMLPEGNGWLVAEFGAQTREEAVEKAKRLTSAYKGKGSDAEVLSEPRQEAKIWDVREAALAVTAHRPDTWAGWEDSAVPREALGTYLRELKALFRQHGYDASVYGHFGDGLVHCSIDFDLRTEAGLANWHSFLEQAADLVVRHGGSFSGEHGDGQARAALLEKMYGPELVQAFREFKAIWDPDGRMNPGKVVDPFPITSNLRMGPDYHPPEIHGHFAYAEDGGSFTRATTRCVGVGACRRRTSEKGVMCPSYMATGEERYSTRGRARLLFEMLHGGPINDRWHSDAVDEALDFCLSCKGCKSDCPVHVDMATYKAEFRSHHYAGRLRPRVAYSMGMIHRWARLASHVPTLANAMMHTPGLAALSKWIGGIAQERTIPPFARESFVHWFRQRRNGHARTQVGRPVILWPDTFNNYFRPSTAIAATRVLENLGFEVSIPDRPLCCGRPLYDWGLLDQAEALWREIMTALRGDIERGTPVVGLEPACVSAFRDELVGLFPDDALAQRLSRQILFFTEFLEQNGDGLSLPKVSSPALVQMHCHHHAVITPDAEEHTLDRLGLDYEVLASGCCGMAGAFGFEAAKYDVSMNAANRVLIPKVRAASEDTLVLADGFSCREQIEQTCGRRTTHIAELIAERMRS